MDEFKAELERAFKIIKMDRQAIAEVAANEGSFQFGLIIVAIGGLLSYLVAFPIGLVIGPVAAVAGAFIIVGVWYLMGSILKLENWDFMTLFRPCSYAYLLSWAGLLQVIPIIGQIVGLAAFIYQLVVSVVIVEELTKTTRGNAVMTIVIPVAICCVAGVALMFFVGFGVLAGLAGMEGVAQQ